MYANTQNQNYALITFWTVVMMNAVLVLTGASVFRFLNEPALTFNLLETYSGIVFWSSLLTVLATCHALYWRKISREHETLVQLGTGLLTTFVFLGMMTYGWLNSYTTTYIVGFLFADLFGLATIGLACYLYNKHRRPAEG
jgi:hypothetical protein